MTFFFLIGGDSSRDLMLVFDWLSVWNHVELRVLTFTRVNIDLLEAFFTFYFTTPDEFTLAFINSLHSFSVVATPTTHDVTSAGTGVIL